MTATLRIEPRWTDLDPAGHVNNSIYLVYAEEARARYLRSALPQTWQMVVVVHNGIDYHSPAEQDDLLDVTSWVEKVGTSSCTSVSLIATTGGRPCATVRTVQAVLRDDREGTRPWMGGERAALGDLIRESAPGSSVPE